MKISMDGKGRYQGNIFVEQLWRTVKYEEVYLKAYASLLEAQRGLEDYFRFYNGLRPHQALDYRAPAEVFHGEQDVVEGDSIGRRCSLEQGPPSLAAEPGFSLNSPLIPSKQWVPPQVRTSKFSGTSFGILRCNLPANRRGRSGTGRQDHQRMGPRVPGVDRVDPKGADPGGGHR